MSERGIDPYTHGSNGAGTSSRARDWQLALLRASQVTIWDFH
jgi:hypothetical protein